MFPTQKNGTYSWVFNNNPINDPTNIVAGANTGSSTYRASRDHFGAAQSVAGLKTVICRYTIGSCIADSTVIVEVDPYNSNPCGGQVSVTDAEGNTYAVVQMGDQCWMQQSMNIGTFKAIGGAWEYGNSGIQKWCSGNNVVNCEKYGGLYEALSAETRLIPKYISNCFHSSSVGKCQPVGQKPFI